MSPSLAMERYSVSHSPFRCRVILTTPALEAAVLMMPEDVYMVKIQNQERLRAYVSKHIMNWYYFVRRTLGRDVSNGDLRVVYGYRKSTAFGMAAISTAKRPTETQLTFSESEIWAHQSGYKYRWSQVGSADIKTGPEYKESAELMYPDFGRSTALPENQCLFVSTVDIKLSTEAWKSIESAATLAIDATHSSSAALDPESHLRSNYHKVSSGEAPSETSSTENHAMHVSLTKSSEVCSFKQTNAK